MSRELPISSPDPSPQVEPPGGASGAPDPLAATHDQFVAQAVASGLSPTRASDAYIRFHRNGADASLPPPPAPLRVLDSDSPEGVVRKFLLAVPAPPSRSEPRPSGRASHVIGAPPLETESVIIPMRSRRDVSHTLCVSSQIGCAMGCEFCETAQMGLLRSLSPAEIVAQWHAARHALGAPIRNIVFMGMGEPLDNLDSVIQAIRILTDHKGPGVAMSRITVSTVGRLDGLVRLRRQVLQPGWRRLNLAVSINAPSEEIRSRIMPINRAMPLADLVALLEKWPVRPAGVICAEYVLIPGVNDADSHADELAALLKSVRCCVNVIPYNPRRGSPWPVPHEADVQRFLRRLESRGQFCKRRRTKGRETMAACGQLGNEHIRRRRLVTLGEAPGVVGAPRSE